MDYWEGEVRARRTAGGITGFGGPDAAAVAGFRPGEGQGVDAALRSVARQPWIAVVYKPRIIKLRSARTAAIWATSASDGLARTATVSDVKPGATRVSG